MQKPSVRETQVAVQVEAMSDTKQAWWHLQHLVADGWSYVNNHICPNISIPIQNTEPGLIFQSHFNVSTEPLEYFQLFSDATVINHT